MSDESELSRWIAVRQCDGQDVTIDADEAERAALAERFDLVSVDALSAAVALQRDGTTVIARGTLNARIVQTCAISGEPLPVTIAEDLHLAFVPETGGAAVETEIEIELAEDDIDEIPYRGERFDLGEAVAQSLGLAIDPYAEGPAAAEIREKVDLSEPPKDGPFAGLAGLKKD